MKISEREKKFVIVGLTLGALVLIFYIVSMLLPSREVLSNNVDYKKKLLAKQRETVGRENYYNSRLEQFRHRLDQDLARLCLIPGDNTSLAGAELQKVLKGIADQNGVEITRKDVQPEQKLQNNVIKIAVRIEVNCLPEQLVQFLAAVENYDKFLSIDELIINSFRIQKRYETRPSIKIAAYLIGADNKPAEKVAASTR